ncbi:MAG: PEP-CTERM sorting domain-containing protein, partial [Planctomycetaceae bacterium]
AFSGNLASVTSVGSAYTAMSFSRTGDLWTSGTASGQSLQFDQATGLLSVVPEPSTWAMLAGVGIAALVGRFRRRRA